MSDVFISYARSTEREARQIAEALRGLGYGVWRDDEVPAHRAYTEVIQERLEAAKAVVVVWSAEAARSEWVRSEAEHARSGHKLVQLTVDGTSLPMPFDQIQCADLSGWTGDLQAPGWKKALASVADLTGAASGAATAGKAPAPPPASICVLPFANMSGESEQEYFSDGISEDIITDLSKVSALFVVARNTAFTFKGKAVEAPQVARQLNVSHLLEGSVRKAGGRVRITAQLIDGVTGGHVWAERYDRELDDIFALQDEISQAIVAALKLKLLPEEKQAIERRGTANAEAYDLYLLARQYRESGNSDARMNETVVRLCKRAIALDPNYAQAWTVMGAAQMSLFQTYGQAGDAGRAAIERALELDPDLGEIHALKAMALRHAGRHEEALAELDVALRLDPESNGVNYRAGVIRYMDRRFVEAARYFGKAAALSETDYDSTAMASSCLEALGDHEGARAAARLTLERTEKVLAQDRSNGRALGKGVVALGTLGQRERAGEWIERALLIDPDNLGMRYDFACAVSLYFHDVEAALALLGPVLADDRAHRLHVAETDPDLDPLRDDPRFVAMLTEAQARMASSKPTPPS